MNHYNDGGGHIESSNIYDEVARFDSIADAQNDSFFSLFLLFFQNYYFLIFDFEIRG